LLLTVSTRVCCTQIYFNTIKLTTDLNFCEKSVFTINTINMFIIIGKKFNYKHSTPRTEKGGNYASLAATWGGGVFTPAKPQRGKNLFIFLNVPCKMPQDNILSRAIVVPSENFNAI
jgi:hypothetical protein